MAMHLPKQIMGGGGIKLLWNRGSFKTLSGLTRWKQTVKDPCKTSP